LNILKEILSAYETRISILVIVFVFIILYVVIAGENVREIPNTWLDLAKTLVWGITGINGANSISSGISYYANNKSINTNKKGEIGVDNESRI
jgi:hypothetical protein